MLSDFLVKNRFRYYAASVYKLGMRESFLFIMHIMPALLFALACIFVMVFAGLPILFPI